MDISQNQVELAYNIVVQAAQGCLLTASQHNEVKNSLEILKAFIEKNLKNENN